MVCMSYILSAIYLLAFGICMNTNSDTIKKNVIYIIFFASEGKDTLFNKVFCMFIKSNSFLFTCLNLLVLEKRCIHCK